jgi:hypothetical protein
MTWIQVTGPGGNLVQLNVDQLVRIRTAQPGEADPHAKSIIDLTNAQFQATIETTEEIMSLLFPARNKEVNRLKTSDK